MFWWCLLLLLVAWFIQQSVIFVDPNFHEVNNFVNDESPLFLAAVCNSNSGSSFEITSIRQAELLTYLQQAHYAKTIESKSARTPAAKKYNDRAEFLHIEIQAYLSSGEPVKTCYGFVIDTETWEEAKEWVDELTNSILVHDPLAKYHVGVVGLLPGEAFRGRIPYTVLSEVVGRLVHSVKIVRKHFTERQNPILVLVRALGKENTKLFIDLNLVSSELVTFNAV